MVKIESGFLEIGRMDTLAAGDSPLHRLDPRAKLLTTLVFIVTVVSFDKYAISALMPFVVYPVSMVAAGGLPLGFLVRKILLVAPFAFFIGIFNPVMDTADLVQIFGLGISGGWISFMSILLRFTLTVSAALILIALTGFNTVCLALEKLGVPSPFVVQLMFLYRYLFVLTDDAIRMVRAISLRSFQSGALRFKTYIALVGHLLLRTLDRAQRIHMAMCCRGFDGHMPILRTMRFGRRELAFVTGWSTVFIALRIVNLPVSLGLWITELLR